MAKQKSNFSEKRCPMRTCIACGKKAEKENFHRIARTNCGQVLLDTTGKANGRGAYVCKEEACIAKAKKKGLISGRLKVNVSQDVFADIEG